jgi:cell division protein FtsQ
MFRKLLKLAGFLLLIIFIIGTLAFTSIESKNIMCTDIEIVFDSDELINVDKDKLIRIVKNTDNKILKKTLGQIN